MRRKAKRVLRLRQLRRSREWTQAELGRRVDLAAATVNEYEHGKKRPSLAKAIALAHVFGVSVESLFEEVEVPS